MSALRTATGALQNHLLVFGAWRRLLFLGAGEVHDQWIAGLLGVRGDDLRGERLDDRLRKLRVVRLLQVRMLWQKSESTRVKLSTHQRMKLKRKREMEGAAAVGSPGAPQIAKLVVCV